MRAPKHRKLLESCFGSMKRRFVSDSENSVFQGWQNGNRFMFFWRSDKAIRLRFGKFDFSVVVIIIVVVVVVVGVIVVAVVDVVISVVVVVVVEVVLVEEELVLIVVVVVVLVVEVVLVIVAIS